MKAHFEREDGLEPGGFLAGHYRAGFATRVVGAMVTYEPPVGGITVLRLTVDGEASGVEIQLVPSEQPVARRRVAIDLAVEADAELRWTAVSGPSGADAPSRIGLAMELVAADLAGLGGGGARMWVRWVNGQEVLRLFEYTPATRTFTASTPGLESGRVAIVNGPDCTITLQGVDALRVTGAGVLEVEGLVATDDVGLNESPRIEFVRDVGGAYQTVGRLSKSGVLQVADVQEAAVAASVDRFELLGGGVLKAAIGPGGLLAEDVEEG